MVTRGPRQSKPKRLEMVAFIKEVADRLFLPEETINMVWETMAQVITEALLREYKVVLRRFGAFRLGKTGGARFRAALTLRQLLKEKAMEKYGVEMDNEAVLLAKVTGQCPNCKGTLDSKDPPHCPQCGTAPFESRKPQRQTDMRDDINEE